MALVHPLLKKSNLDKSELKNFRPISNLTFLSKLIERAVCSQLTLFLESNDLLPHVQSAYRHGHSTETALLKVYSDLADAVDRGEVTLLGLLDLSSAFDTVDYDILLHRLKLTHGISGGALAWIQSYLTGRVKTVVVDGVESTPKLLVRGVPQGSVLGPLLFVLYTADIPNFKSFDLSSHVYADDTQIYFYSTPDRALEIASKVGVCFTAVKDWMSSNRLRLNPDKTELIWIASPHHLRALSQDPITLDLIDIKPSTSP